jgi:Ca-activated chloride channel family protein
MKDHHLDTLLTQNETPAVDENAKKRAINLAMAEFTQRQLENSANKPQGFQQRTRLISNFFVIGRRNLMLLLNNKRFYSGVATLSVAAIAIVIFQRTPLDTSKAVEQLHEEKTSYTLPSEDKSPIAQADKNTDAASTTAQTAIETRAQSATNNQAIKPSKESAKRTAESFAAISPAPQAEMRDRNLSKIMAPQEADSNQLYYKESRDRFEKINPNTIKQVNSEPVSTFSIDVDTAAYSFIRRQLNQGLLPQKDAVRVEEMINYFPYDYPLPDDKAQAFKPSITVLPSPWSEDKKLIHIGIKGYDITPTQQPRSNLVLLLDVSGSMDSTDKLPLVKQSMGLLLNSLQPEDTIAIVVYAGAAGAVLKPTPAKEKQTILNALNRLHAGGSTAGAQGIQLAYQLAEANFDKNAVNRIILATDGDFNVGINNDNELKGFIERKREQGIFLSVLGFGQGNYQDQLMQTLAQNGNGIAAYIDTLSEAQKILIDEATSTLFPIAKDVKIQVEFNPDTVAEYRLIGYETRQLNQEDFNNDAVDAGDIGAGHSVTAIYEITPKETAVRAIDPLRYQHQTNDTPEKAHSNEYGFLKIRYKHPTEHTSQLISQVIATTTVENSDALFATAVAAFGQLLTGSPYISQFSYDDIIQLAQANKGADTFGYRTEFIQLVRKAKIAAAL